MGILTVQNVNKRFGGLKALHEVNLDITEGAVHAIIGPNGAGKSTLLNCFVGRDDGVDGALGDVEVDLVEGFQPAEALVDVLHGQDAHGVFS
ncbi:MAG: ATP-binding cassette domain-containing protein, partial [Pseudomonadota bacterium]